MTNFKAVLMSMEEIGKGYEFQHPVKKHCLEIVLELMRAEGQCCRFLKFALTAGQNLGPLTVRIMGPNGTKNFLIALQGKVELEHT